jgi:hypothetical protein
MTLHKPPTAADRGGMYLGAVGVERRFVNLETIGASNAAI